MIKISQYGLGKSTFLLTDGNGTQLGFITKQPKHNKIGQWDWFWRTAGLGDITGPFRTKQAALDNFKEVNNYS